MNEELKIKSLNAICDECSSKGYDRYSTYCDIDENTCNICPINSLIKDYEEVNENDS